MAIPRIILCTMLLHGFDRVRNIIPYSVKHSSCSLLCLLFSFAMVICTSTPSFSQAGSPSVYKRAFVGATDSSKPINSEGVEPTLLFKDIDINWGETSSGWEVEVQFTLHYTSNIIGSYESLLIVPTYYNKPGGNVAIFPHIRLNGKNKHPYYLREEANMSHAEYIDFIPYKVVKLASPREQFVRTLTYKYSLPVEHYSPTGYIELQQLLQDCCTLTPIGSHRVTLNPEKRLKRLEQPLPATITEDNVVFVRPEDEKVKLRSEQLSIRIQYPVDKDDVRPYYAYNRTELERCYKVLNPITSEHDTYTLNAISILGYASPEAPYAYNLALSERRAYGFLRYMNQIYGATFPQSIQVRGMGEDWSGLRKLVQQSYLVNKNQVLAIIDNHYDDYDQKENRLRKLMGGDTYRYLYDNLYPSLRRIDMILNYTVRAFDTNEALARFDNRPQDLSQREIYDVAQQRNHSALPPDKQNYGREYDKAAELFGNDVAALINASSAALIRGELDKAWLYLEKIQTDPRAYNNLGVYYWLKRNYSLARKYFQNVPRAERNIAERNLKRMDQELLK